MLNRTFNNKLALVKEISVTSKAEQSLTSTGQAARLMSLSHACVLASYSFCLSVLSESHREQYDPGFSTVLYNW